MRIASLISLLLILSHTSTAVSSDASVDRYTKTPYTLTITPNAPLMDSGCVDYRGEEALHAVYQLVASARFSVEVYSPAIRAKTFLTLLEKKALGGRRVKVVTAAPVSGVSGVSLYQFSGESATGLTIVVDGGAAGKGSIFLGEVVEVNSGFRVCRDARYTDSLYEKLREFPHDRTKNAPRTSPVRYLW